MSSGDDWPAKPWRLAAPETYMLPRGEKADGGEAFKLALVELVARGSLQMVDRGQAGTAPDAKGDFPILARGPKAGRPEERSLAAAWDLYESLPLAMLPDGSQGVPLVHVVRIAAREYGSLARFTGRVVLPGLVEQGLYTQERYRVLGIFPKNRYVMTPAGRAAQTDLEAWMTTALKQFPRLSEEDPARALVFAVAAGSAVLLMQPLESHFQRLREQMGREMVQRDLDSSYSGTTVEGDGGEAIGALSLPDLDLGALQLGLDLGALERLGDLFSDIASGMDAGDSSGGGGGDGGSDGGSSDGGSSDGGGDG